MHRLHPQRKSRHLAAGTAQLADSIQRGQEPGVIAKARDRLEKLLAEAEAHAPAAVTLAEQVVDALAVLGI